MIFILNSNPISLSFYKSWSFNMVSKPSLVRGHGFKPHICNLFPIWTLFGLFDSPLASMGLHMREGVKRHDIHIKLKSYKLELLGELVV